MSKDVKDKFLFTLSGDITLPDIRGDEIRFNLYDDYCDDYYEILIEQYPKLAAMSDKNGIHFFIDFGDKINYDFEFTGSENPYKCFLEHVQKNELYHDLWLL